MFVFDRLTALGFVIRRNTGTMLLIQHDWILSSSSAHKNKCDYVELLRARAYKWTDFFLLSIVYTLTDFS